MAETFTVPAAPHVSWRTLSPKKASDESFTFLLTLAFNAHSDIAYFRLPPVITLYRRVSYVVTFSGQIRFDETKPIAISIASTPEAPPQIR